MNPNTRLPILSNEEAEKQASQYRDYICCFLEYENDPDIFAMESNYEEVRWELIHHYASLIGKSIAKMIPSKMLDFLSNTEDGEAFMEEVISAVKCPDVHFTGSWWDVYRDLRYYKNFELFGE